MFVDQRVDQLDVPVVLILFNRPETTRRVFEQIALARPRRLYLIADGPRKGYPADPEDCERARQVAQAVDWDCDLKVDFSAENLGLKRRVISGLNRVFSQEEQAIILEDDCVPDPSFFRFCQELLARYQDADQVMMIAGTNYQFGRRQEPYSYYFSIYTHIWGWATWRRAWKMYDGEMRQWPEARRSVFLRKLLTSSKAEKFWAKRFQMTYEGKIDTWDYPWTLSCWLQDGLTVIPAVNLVSNIGFGSQATHTLGRRNRLADMPARAIGFPLLHPPQIVPDQDVDDFTQRTVFVEHRLAPLKKVLKRWLAHYRITPSKS